MISAKSGNNFEPQGTMTQGEFMDALILAHGWYGFPHLIEGNKELTKKESLVLIVMLSSQDK